jgi:Mg-chelatase subunit ChlD
MRMMLKAHLDTQSANIALSDGTLEKVLGKVLGMCKPEAAYFCTETGRRTVYAVFDMTDSSTLPEIAEPLFQSLGAEVLLIPVMVQDELQKGIMAWAEGRH